MYKSALQVLDQRKSACLAELDSINALIKIEHGKTLVKCEKNNYGPGCGQALHLNELEYIQTHYYVRPSGCMGGDYWKPDEGQFDCPHCGHRNRLYSRPEISALKYVFKSIVEEHKD